MLFVIEVDNIEEIPEKLSISFKIMLDYLIKNNIYKVYTEES